MCPWWISCCSEYLLHEYPLSTRRIFLEASWSSQSALFSGLVSPYLINCDLIFYTLHYMSCRRELCCRAPLYPTGEDNYDRPRQNAHSKTWFSSWRQGYPSNISLVFLMMNQWSITSGLSWKIWLIATCVQLFSHFKPFKECVQISSTWITLAFLTSVNCFGCWCIIHAFSDMH